MSELFDLKTAAKTFLATFAGRVFRNGLLGLLLGGGLFLLLWLFGALTPSALFSSFGAGVGSFLGFFAGLFLFGAYCVAGATLGAMDGSARGVFAGAWSAVVEGFDIKTRLAQLFDEVLSQLGDDLPDSAALRASLTRSVESWRRPFSPVAEDGKVLARLRAVCLRLINILIDMVLVRVDNLIIDVESAGGTAAWLSERRDGWIDRLLESVKAQWAGALSQQRRVLLIVGAVVVFAPVFAL
jgi:hypothetical protein